MTALLGMDREAIASLIIRPQRANQALEQTRDSVLRYGESVGCELLNFFVLDTEIRLCLMPVPAYTRAYRS